MNEYFFLDFFKSLIRSLGGVVLESGTLGEVWVLKGVGSTALELIQLCESHEVEPEVGASSGSAFGALLGGREVWDQF